VPTLLLALVLGLLVAVWAASPGSEAVTAGTGGGLEQRPLASHTGARASEDSPDLAAAQALRDGAEALTLAQVELDEGAAEEWLPRLAMIDDALDDPRTTPAIREELAATRRALARLGLGSAAVDGSPTAFLEASVGSW